MIPSKTCFFLYLYKVYHYPDITILLLYDCPNSAVCRASDRQADFRMSKAWVQILWKTYIFTFLLRYFYIFGIKIIIF